MQTEEQNRFFRARRVLADVVRIREVLVNILGNAVKFTNDGGNVTFEMESRPGKDPKHIVVRYRITDDGVGMSEEFQKHIFEEFAQEESGAQTQYKGTGLGMTISNFAGCRDERPPLEAHRDG